MREEGAGEGEGERQPAQPVGDLLRLLGRPGSGSEVAEHLGGVRTRQYTHLEQFRSGPPTARGLTARDQYGAARAAAQPAAVAEYGGVVGVVDDQQPGPVGPVQVVPDQVRRGAQSAARGHQLALCGAAVGGDGEHAGAQRGGVGGVHPQADAAPAPVRGRVLEECAGDGGLAAAAESVEDVDLAARARGDGGPQRVHQLDAVAEYERGAAQCGAAYRVRAGPRGGVVVVFDDVLVAGGLVDPAVAAGTAVHASVHRGPMFTFRPAW
ncbi:hypothetical protein [Streptomyces sp. NBC_00555]|uniref:hypothetical protein n=1 Tax=Streptomyces sp. NBC_00555 TaxID=2903662 RepID=UPI002B1E06F5|nr:hypothetical protein [Streptomyces sp. NBC_00555]